MIKFPTQWNRELIGPYQRIKSARQGSLPLDHGSPSGWSPQPAENQPLDAGRRARMSRSLRRRLRWPLVLPHRRMFPSHRALPHHVCSRCLIALRPNASSFSRFLISAACCCGPCGVVGDAPASSKRSGKSTGLWGKLGNQAQHASRRPLRHSLRRRCEFGARLWLIVNRYVTIFRRRFWHRLGSFGCGIGHFCAGRKARLHR